MPLTKTWVGLYFFENLMDHGENWTEPRFEFPNPIPRMQKRFGNTERVRPSQPEPGGTKKGYGGPPPRPHDKCPLNPTVTSNATPTGEERAMPSPKPSVVRGKRVGSGIFARSRPNPFQATLFGTFFPPSQCARPFRLAL